MGRGDMNCCCTDSPKSRTRSYILFIFGAHIPFIFNVLFFLPNLRHLNLLLYVCTFWPPSLKPREVHTKHQAQRQIGIAHEASRADVVDGDVGFHAEPPRWSEGVATAFASGRALPRGRHRPAWPRSRNARWRRRSSVDSDPSPTLLCHRQRALRCPNGRRCARAAALGSLPDHWKPNSVPATRGRPTTAARSRLGTGTSCAPVSLRHARRPSSFPSAMPTRRSRSRATERYTPTIVATSSLWVRWGLLPPATDCT